MKKSKQTNPSPDLENTDVNPPPDVDSQQQDISPEDLLNHIKGLIDKGQAYREIIPLIADVKLFGDRELLIDRLRRREKINGITKEAIKHDVDHCIWEQPIVIENDVTEDKVIELTEEEKKEALSLLNDRKLITRFIETTELLGTVGETVNKVMLYMTMTSRRQDSPASVTVKGESSAGKSYLVNTVTPFFPPEDILEFTQITPKALFHRKTSLKHKILIIHERPGAEAADYSIRILQSEKKLTFTMPVKDKTSGEFESKDFQVDGPIAYIETTTKTHLHSENETRCFDIYVDESEEQTKRIHQVLNRKHEIEALDHEKLLRPWINAQRLLEPYPVYVPYMEYIKFPTKPVRVRRDKLKFISLIEVSAFLRQHIREKRIVNGRESIVATIDDYRVAHRLIVKILESVLEGLSPKVKELLEAVKQITNKDFTKKDILEIISWNIKTVDKYLFEAIDWGYIEITKEGGRGVEYHYKLKKLDLRHIDILTPEELEREILKNTTSIPSESP
jgi:hypothetical protein